MWYYDQFILDPRDVFDIINYRLQGYILRKILWPGGGNGAGEKMKNEAVRNKMKKKEKGKKKKG